MSRVKSSEVERKWRGHLEAMASSGLSAQAYATREGVSVASLWAWKRRLRGGSSSRFVPVVVADAERRGRQGFELVLRDGISLRIPPDFDDATLARLVRALGAGR